MLNYFLNDCHKIVNLFNMLISIILVIKLILIEQFALTNCHLDIVKTNRNNPMFNLTYSQKTLDDSISYTDYLITIYSSSTTKPCLYFCKYSKP